MNFNVHPCARNFNPVKASTASQDLIGRERRKRLAENKTLISPPQHQPSIETQEIAKEIVQPITKEPEDIKPNLRSFYQIHVHYSPQADIASSRILTFKRLLAICVGMAICLLFIVIGGIIAIEIAANNRHGLNKLVGALTFRTFLMAWFLLFALIIYLLIFYQ